MNELRQLCVLIMTSFFATATISVMPLFLFKNKATFTSYFFTLNGMLTEDGEICYKKQKKDSRKKEK